MDRERYETGLRIRKEVLGEDYVARKLDEADDFDAEFQNVVTEAWGATWGRGVLTKRERSMMNLGCWRRWAACTSSNSTSAAPFATA